MRKNWIVVIGIIFFMGSNAFAQAKFNKAEIGKRGGVIFGRVFSSEKKVPMEYTNVALYSLPDSALITGGITNKTGAFRFTGLKNGNYYLIAHFIGFKTKKVNKIILDDQHRFVKLPPIFLSPASSTLKGVEVKARQPRISYQIDKKVINVSQDLNAASGTAVDVLENVPSVNVDIEGNVSLRGSSSFTVLINGRPSVLSGSDALQQIPSSAIDKIEVITNPSAKYDPEGVGGIINIILKKDKKLGLNGIASGSVGTRNKYQGNILLSYRKGKINYYVSVDGMNRDMHMKVKLNNQTFRGDTTNYRISNLTGTRSRRGYGVKGGADINFTKKTGLFLSAKVGGYGFGMNNDSKQQIYTLPATLEKYSNSVSNSNRWGNYYTGQAEFQHKFNEHGHQLDLLFFYSTRKSDDSETQSDYITNMNWERLNYIPSQIQTNTYDTSSDMRIKVDYALPVGKKGKFEAGYQTRIANLNGEYNFMNFDTLSGTWVSNSARSSFIKFHRNIYALYVSFKNQYKKLGYEFGLRGEYTDRSVNNLDGTKPFVISRMDYFPSGYLSYKLSKKSQVYASYSRRIDRPGNWSLNPFPMVIDPYNLRVGNPELQPEYIDSFELGTQKSIKKGFLSFETYYRIGRNKISRVVKLDTATGIMVHTSANLNTDYSLGMEFMANLRPVKWFNLNFSGNIYHYRLQGNVTGSNVSAKSTNWTGRLTASFNLKNNFRIQMMGIYISPSATVQGSRKGFAYTNLALRKDFFKRKLNITLSARDLLGTARYEFQSSGSNFRTYTTMQREWPVISLNVNYIINNYKQKRKRPSQNSDQGVPNDIGF